MKVLFLDVDGVLNTSNYIGTMNKGMVQTLKYIVDKTGCKIVMSSTWRVAGYGIGTLFNTALMRCDPSDTVIKSVIGVTPQGGDRIDEIGKDYVRGNEIQLWIDDNEFDGKFAILDDDSDMAHLSPKLVKTNPEIGLTRADADKVISLLTD